MTGARRSGDARRDAFAALVARGVADARRGKIFDAVPAPLPPERRDRLAGMLLGLAIGDALGNTSEGIAPRERRAALGGDVRDYLPNRHAGGREVGLPSDDTQLAFRTLEVLLDCDGALDCESLAARFANGRIFGLGSTVSAFLRARAAGVRPWHACGQSSAGNGALMRIAPIVAPHLGRPSPQLWDDAALAGMVTHNDSASVSSCVAFVAILRELMAMHAAPAPDWWLRRWLEVSLEVETARAYRPRAGRVPGFSGTLSALLERVLPAALASGAEVVDACEAWYSGAYLLETVPSVLYILARHGHDAEEAVVRAATDTRDNDTIAAIVGAAVGALHGRQGLPERWVRGLLGRTGADDDGRVFELVATAVERWA